MHCEYTDLFDWGMANDYFPHGLGILVANVTLSIEEIVARVIQQEAWRNPRARDVHLVIFASAAGFAALLLAQLFAFALPPFAEWFAPFGPPWAVLLTLGMLAESFASIGVLLRRREDQHSILAQKVAAGALAVSCMVIGFGAVLFVVWIGLLARYYPDTTWFADVGLALMMAGVAGSVASLPVFATSAIRSRIDDAD